MDTYPLAPTLRAEFEANGGYDCITDAVNLTDPAGQRVAVLDVRHACANLFGRGAGIDSERATAEQQTRAYGARLALSYNHAPALVAALRNLPDDAGMIEHNPDEGMRLFCCGGDVITYLGARDDTVKHRADCWYTAARAALAAYDEEAAR